MRTKAKLPQITRGQLIEIFAEKQGIPVSKAEKIAKTILGQIKDQIEAGGRVELRGFGMWDVKEVPAYIGRHPKSGERINVPTRRKVSFKASRLLLAKINGVKS